MSGSCDVRYFCTYALRSSGVSIDTSGGGWGMRYGNGEGKGVTYEKCADGSLARERRKLEGFSRRSFRNSFGLGAMGSGVRFLVSW